MNVNTNSPNNKSRYCCAQKSKCEYGSQIFEEMFLKWKLYNYPSILPNKKTQGPKRNHYKPITFFPFIIKIIIKCKLIYMYNLPAHHTHMTALY